MTKRINKESVKLRQRTNASGSISLYLDIYRRGQRKCEYLNMYLVPETNREARDKNKQTLALAEAIRSKRAVELLNDEYGFKTKHDDVLFFPYAKKVAEEKKKPETINSVLYHIRDYYKKDDFRISQIDKRWIEGFLVHLSKAGLASNSRYMYFATLRSLIRRAVKDDIITKDPTKSIDTVKRVDTEREFLTIEEVRKLANTPCFMDIVKRTFLFSCLTGLRRSDIEKLVWGEVQQRGEVTRLVFRQKKTGGLEYLDISTQAVPLMGERGAATQKVFKDFPSSSFTNVVLKQWISSAGIEKKITFHCGRHTFAVMMLDLGVDLFTVSKLLGHRDVTTTQIYAKVLDKNKQAAVEKIPSIF